MNTSKQVRLTIALMIPVGENTEPYWLLRWHDQKATSIDGDDLTGATAHDVLAQFANQIVHSLRPEEET